MKILYVYTLQRPVLHLDVSTLQRPVLHLDVSTFQGPKSHLDPCLHNFEKIQYEFEHFNCQFCKIFKINISALAEVKSAIFFLVH